MCVLYSNCFLSGILDLQLPTRLDSWDFRSLYIGQFNTPVDLGLLTWENILSSVIFILFSPFWSSLGPVVCNMHAGMHHGRKWKKLSRILRGGIMMSATGNMMFLQAASHDTASELLFSVSFPHSRPRSCTLSF